MLACCIGLLPSRQAAGQDTVRLRNGRSFATEIVEINDDYFLFRNDARVDSVYRLNKADVASISYKSGFREVYGEATAPAFDTITLNTLNAVEGRIVEVQEKGIVFRDGEGELAANRFMAFDSIAYIHYANGFAEKYNDLQIHTVGGQIIGEKAAIAAPRNDTVFLLDAAPVPGFVTKIGKDTISVARILPMHSSLTSIPRGEIARILYANGYTDTYNGPTSPSAPAPAVATSKPTAKPETTLTAHYASYSDETLRKIPLTRAIPAGAAAESVQSLDLSYRKLISLPPGVDNLPGLLILNLDHNNFKSVPEVVFGIQSLYWLTVNNCQLKSMGDIPRKPDSSNLALISLVGNKLSSVEGNLFLFPNLQHIDLSGNLIKTVHNPSRKATVNTHIESINLSHNQLRDVPGALSRITHLADLNLSFNHIRHIEPADLALNELQKLNLSGNPLEGDGREIFTIHSLQEIDLTGTLLTSISDSLRHEQALTVLRLPSNLRSFPSFLGEVKSLKELALAGDKNIHQFPTEILELNRLENLNLSSTPIGSLPEDIGKLRRLKTVSLAGCGLSTIPASLFNLARLQRVDLSQNNIRSIPGTLGSLAQLEFLDLESSPVEEASLLKLKQALPYATIKYYSPELATNYESKPLPADDQQQFVNLFQQCDQGNVNSCYLLGDLFEKNGDYGYALSIFYRIADNLSPEGSAQHAVAANRIAEIYDDADNKRAYVSVYKRKQYADYNDYVTNLNHNRALTIYCRVCQETAADASAYQVMQKACAKASLIYNELYKNLAAIFEQNSQEIQRLIGGAATMATVGEGGNYMMNTATTTGGVYVGGALSLFATVSKTAKETKSQHLQEDNNRLRGVIEETRQKAEAYINMKP
jgi:Leucine-rich repeat (LRR) protein